MNILAGDIGGTKTELAVFNVDQIRSASFTAPLFALRFLNREQAGFIPMLHHFLRQVNIPTHSACFAVAGAVRNGHTVMPNLNWILDENEIGNAFNVKQVRLINDLAATAHGALSLKSNQLMVLNSGQPEINGNLAIIAAGTGLGEAVLFSDDHGYYHVSASEGGHADYAPNSEEDVSLLRYLWAKFGHVSWERVVSGPGIANIYGFLSQTGQHPEATQVTNRIAEAMDWPAVIVQAALAGESPRCVEALNIFFHNYGSAAGNLALKALATGGLYIGGGIAPKLAQYINKGAFMQAFSNKGRFAEMMGNMPVKLILESKTALFGAAVYAEKKNAK